MTTAYPETTMSSALQEAFLSVIKDALLRTHDVEKFGRIPPSNKTFIRTVRSLGYAAVNRLLRPTNLALVQMNRYTGETMLDGPRVDNIRQCIQTIIDDGVAGDLLEAGVW